MKLDAAHVGEPHQRLHGVGQEEVDDAALRIGDDRGDAHPIRLVSRGPFLVERRTGDPIRVTRHRDWPPRQMGKQSRSDRGVVLDQVAFGGRNARFITTVGGRLLRHEDLYEDRGVFCPLSAPPKRSSHRQLGSLLPRDNATGYGRTYRQQQLHDLLHALLERITTTRTPAAGIAWLDTN